jgi:hypothetical protein
MRPDARLCYLGGRKKVVSYVTHLTYIEGANAAVMQFIHSHEGIPLLDRINKILKIQRAGMPLACAQYGWYSRIG